MAFEPAALVAANEITFSVFTLIAKAKSVRLDLSSLLFPFNLLSWPPISGEEHLDPRKSEGREAT